MHDDSIVFLYSPLNIGATECNRNDTSREFYSEYRHLNILAYPSTVSGLDKTVDV